MRNCTLLCAFALGISIALDAAHASGFTVLYTFAGSDGAHPTAGLLLDKTGNLFGTTSVGGADDGGTVFELASDGTETVLHSFAGSDGENPAASLVADASGNLYGTTTNGGSGGGTVFEVSLDGTETSLYNFTHGDDGSAPLGGVIRDRSGNLYGTADVYGRYGYGTVFRLSPTGTLKVLHAFGHGNDGQHPQGNLIMDKAGNLYGTTTEGGSGGLGTVYELARDGTETILHSFTANEGSFPGGVIADTSGNLYGTNLFNGSDRSGTAFSLAPDGTLTVLHTFAGGSDGALPNWGLVRDKAGNLYGTTEIGGGTGCEGNVGCGTVFKIAPDGTETVLYAFHQGKDGIEPAAGLIAGGAGNLYGTAYMSGGRSGDGTIFKLTK